MIADPNARHQIAARRFPWPRKTWRSRLPYFLLVFAQTWHPSSYPLLLFSATSRSQSCRTSQRTWGRWFQHDFIVAFHINKEVVLILKSQQKLRPSKLSDCSRLACLLLFLVDSTPVWWTRSCWSTRQAWARFFSLYLHHGRTIGNKNYKFPHPVSQWSTPSSAEVFSKGCQVPQETYHSVLRPLKLLSAIRIRRTSTPRR